MNNQSFLDMIDSFIREGNLEKAIIELNVNITSTDAMHLSGRISSLNQKIRNAIISDEDADLERNKIQYSLIDYCKSLRSGPNPTTQNFNPETFDNFSDDNFSDGSVIVETSKIEIEIKINRDFKTYTSEEQRKLLNAIANLLEINSNINIKNMKEGSVILTLELTPEQGEKLSLAIMSGALSEFDVVDSKIKYDYPAYYSNLKSSENDELSTFDVSSDNFKLLQKEIVNLEINDLIVLLDNMRPSKRKDLIRKIPLQTSQKDFDERLVLSVTRVKVIDVFLSNLTMGKKLTFSEIMQESNLESRKLVVDVINELFAAGLVERMKEGGKLLWQISYPAYYSNLKSSENDEPSRLDDLFDNSKLLQIQVGQLLVGKVKSMNLFGAVLDIGNIDAVLLRSEIAWYDISHPREVLSVGQTVIVKVIDTNPKYRAIIVSKKQIIPNPLTLLGIGEMHSVEVYKITDDIVSLKHSYLELVVTMPFSSIEPGFREEIKLGSSIYLKILGVNIEDGRIDFALGVEVEKEAKEYFNVVFLNRSIGNFELPLDITKPTWGIVSTGRPNPSEDQVGQEMKGKSKK